MSSSEAAEVEKGGMRVEMLHSTSLMCPPTHQDVLAVMSRQTLNFSASDIAAMSGFHPYKNLPQLVLRLVYQGRLGTLLQTMDARAMGLAVEFVTEEQVFKNLAAQAGSSTAKALEKAISKKPQTVQEATALKEKVLKEAKESRKLNSTEFKVLQEGTRHMVNTRFGNHHEDNALDQCEIKFGWEIFNRNTEIMEWRFKAVPGTGTVEAIEDAKPRRYGDRRARNFTRASEGKRLRTEEGTVYSYVDLTKDAKEDDGIVDSSERDSSTSDSKDTMDSKPVSEAAPEVTQQGEGDIKDTVVDMADVLPKSKAVKERDGASDPYPFFVVRGSVDGRRDELAPSQAPAMDEFDNWTMRPIVVELKHRMNRLFSFPPLYEQIQAIVYCLMYRVNDADIVQVIRLEEKESIRDAETQQAVNKKTGSTDEDDVKATTIQDYFVAKEAAQVSGESNTNTKCTTDSLDLLEHTDAARVAAKEGEEEEEAENKDPNVCKTYEPMLTEADDMTPKPAESENQRTSETEKAKTMRSEDTNLAKKQPTLTASEGITDVTPNTDAEEEVKLPVVRDPALKEPLPSDNAENSQRRESDSRRRKPKQLSLQADRVSMDDPMYQHGRNWHSVILPRLHSFAKAVYTIRQDDSKRCRLLQSCSDPLGQLEQHAWELLLDECEWLKDSDTAFRRGRRA